MKKSILIILLAIFSALAMAEPKLKIHWLGTASYLIEYGDVSILTDPFYSQSSLLKTGLGSVQSKPTIVSQVIRSIRRQNHPIPSAIFIGHSHYDHMLDTAELLRQTQWTSTPIYGSQTTYNILAGYGNDIAKHFHQAQADEQWHEVSKGVRYMAIKAEHANQLPGIFFYAGAVHSPLNRPPHKASEFKLGETYTYIFELTQGSNKKTLFFTGAATTYPAGVPHTNSIERVDVAILCVPSWQYTKGYPDLFIKHLKPAVIIPSHYNDFLSSIDNFHQPRKELWVARLDKFLLHLRTLWNYPEFRRIYVPKVNDVIIL